MNLQKSLLLVLFIFSVFSVSSQTLIDDTQILNVLIFKNEEKDKIKMVSQTGKIKYKLRSNDKKVITGVLEEIKDNSMVVSGTEVAFDNCDFISGRVFNSETLAGGVLTGVGFSSVVVGASLMGNIIVGGTVLGAGAVVLGVGLVLTTKMKRFNLNKGWDVYSGKIKYNPTK